MWIETDQAGSILQVILFIEVVSAIKRYFET